jgi:hypothetical protein
MSLLEKMRLAAHDWEAARVGCGDRWRRGIESHGWIEAFGFVFRIQEEEDAFWEERYGKPPEIAVPKGVGPTLVSPFLKMQTGKLLETTLITPYQLV